jgi:hypothetical protein
MKKKCLKDRTNSSKLLSHKKCYFGLKKGTNISLYSGLIFAGALVICSTLLGPLPWPLLIENYAQNSRAWSRLFSKSTKVIQFFVSKMFLDKEKNGCCSVFFLKGVFSTEISH